MANIAIQILFLEGTNLIFYKKPFDSNLKFSYTDIIKMLHLYWQHNISCIWLMHFSTNSSMDTTNMPLLLSICAFYFHEKDVMKGFFPQENRKETCSIF